MLQMHLMPKCILAYIFLWKMFSVHFPKENVQLCKNAFLHHIFQRKMFSNAVQKCIWCKNAFLQRNAYILRSKMFSITFSFGKCSAPAKCKGSTKNKHYKMSPQGPVTSPSTELYCFFLFCYFTKHLIINYNKKSKIKKFCMHFYFFYFYKIRIYKNVLKRVFLQK